jgi:hypothetical protein
METPKYAWIALLAVSVLSLTIGVGDYFLAGDGDPALAETMTGTPWDEMKKATPRIVNLTNLLSRILGAWLIGFSILGIGVSLIPYRRGERWAWYVLWSMPLAFLLVFVAFLTIERVPNSPTPPALLSAPGLLAISTLALLLPVRTFLAKSDGQFESSGAEMPNDDDHATD